MCLEIRIVSYLPENILHTQYIMHNVMNNFTVFLYNFYILRRFRKLVMTKKKVKNTPNIISNLYS